jgi:predicted kinase
MYELHDPAFLVYVNGVTNAGKSTFINAAPADWGRVEVGKMMRAKYPPSYFAGQCNPKHTAAEAWQMYVDGIRTGEAEGRRVIVIDGQPRDSDQCEAIIADRRHHGRRLFLHLWAPPDTLLARARARDGDDADKLALTMARLTNDVTPNYDLLCRLTLAREPIVMRNTKAAAWNITDVVRDVAFLAGVAHAS